MTRRETEPKPDRKGHSHPCRGPRQGTPAISFDSQAVWCQYRTCHIGLILYRSQQISLDHAILGFLNYQPFSGYDLKKIFDATVKHFWPADQSQIYRTLARLTEQGCVSMQKVGQSSRPNRKVYRITRAGRQELARWITAPFPPTTAVRRAALVPVFFLGQLSDKEILAKFEDFAETMRATLKVYDQVGQKVSAYADQIGSARETFFWLSTLDLGKRSMRANLEWAESVISQIKGGKVPRERRRISR